MVKVAGLWKSLITSRPMLYISLPPTSYFLSMPTTPCKSNTNFLSSGWHHLHPPGKNAEVVHHLSFREGFPGLAED